MTAEKVFETTIRTITPIMGLLAFVLMAPQVNAATISGSFSNVGNSDFNLTALGSEDWAYWSGTTPDSGNKTNEKLGGSLISNMAAVGGGGLAASSSTTRPLYDFAFTDGTSPVGGSVDDARGLWSTVDVVDRGVSVNVTLPDVEEYMVYLWAGAFRADEGTLTASLPGAASFVDSSLTGSESAPKTSVLYTLLVKPDQPDDVLNLTLLLTDDGDSNSSHVLISAVAVQLAIPEPHAFGLLAVALAGLGWFGWRRRPNLRG